MAEKYSSLQKKSTKTLVTFFSQVIKDYPQLKASEAAKKYIDQQLLSPSETNDVYRLVGLYVQTQHKLEMIDVLSELVEIQTNKTGKLPQYKNPEIQKFGKKIQALATSYGLNYRNIDHRIFEVTLPGTGSETLGIYTHADVVPADPKKWILPNGTRLDPFKVTLLDGKIYGRGTEDDKCSIVAALIAMRTIKESKLPIKRNIRLIIETTEETGGEGFEYYKKRNKLPEHNLVLDSGYPLITAENGFGEIYVSFPIRKAKGNLPIIENVTGGTAINQIPSSSEITIVGPDDKSIQSLGEKVISYAQMFIQRNGANFEIKTKEDKNRLLITVEGVSAHSASPETGVNPVSRAFVLLHELNTQFAENHFTDAAEYVAESYGVDYFGKKLGIDYEDDFMGPLTVSVTHVAHEKGVVKIGVNLRAPRGKEPKDLKKEIETKLARYRPKVSIRHYMYRDPKGNWIQEMLTVFIEVTDREGKPLSSAGSTTAKLLPNGINFGPAMPDEKYMGHNANEFKRIKNFMLDAQMFSEVFLRLANLEKMD